jgi:molybdenum cofactor guanylyltransferase
MLTGVILAGGKNRSMKGAAKALLTCSEEKLIERQIREMKLLCREVIVVTNEPRLFLPILGGTVRIITDFFSGKGPLGGMHAALSLASYSQVWAVGCDMPFISADAADFLWKRKSLSDVEAAIPSVDGKPQPFHGIYDKRCRDACTLLMQRGEYRMNELLKHVRWEEIQGSLLEEQGISSRFAVNVNTQLEYEQALSQLTNSAG